MDILKSQSISQSLKQRLHCTLFRPYLIRFQIYNLSNLYDLEQFHGQFFVGKRKVSPRVLANLPKSCPTSSPSDIFMFFLDYLHHWISKITGLDSGGFFNSSTFRLMATITDLISPSHNFGCFINSCYFVQLSIPFQKLAWMRGSPGQVGKTWYILRCTRIERGE